MSKKEILADYIILYPIISDDPKINGLSCFSYLLENDNNNIDKKPNFIINCIKKIIISTEEDIEKNQIRLQLNWLSEIAGIEFREEIIRKKEKKVEMQNNWLLEFKNYETAIITSNDSLLLTKTRMVSSKFLIDWKDHDKLEILPRNNSNRENSFLIRHSKREITIKVK